MPEFDPHTAIKRLAEAERECPVCKGTHTEWSAEEDLGAVDGIQHLTRSIGRECTGCKGTGHIVPFASLRVECNPDSFDHQRGTCDCEDSGWVPEPAVEKACWRIHISHPYICYATTIEEELRGAEAWLEEEKP